jgi:hypothetical protein
MLEGRTVRWHSAGMSKGYRRSFWRKLVGEVDGGRSVREVAQRHGVKYGTLMWWRWRFRSEQAEHESQATFLPVVVRQPAETACKVLEVVVGEFVVRVTAGMDPAYVAALAGALRQC